jgi:hypothetical protein
MTPSGQLMKHSFIALAFAAILATPGPAFSATKGPATTMPDFTEGDTVAKDGPHDWTLGPTGARGWIFTANGHSRDARQILVTAVAQGAPADGVLRVGDVILGVEGKDFSGDARVVFAKAITAAEAETGTLQLLRWRAGKTEAVEVKLAVLGTYSAIAPYDCPKSKRLFELGCASLAKRMVDEKTYTKNLNPIPRALNALALLASRNKEWLPLVKREAQWAADFTTSGYLSWFYGYNMALVGEYVMATGDQSVMPGLTRLALETARGQSGVGTWGHRFAEGGGNLGGYGAMNAPGLPLTIGMVLAREAGVKHPDLDRAITKAAAFLRWYVHKGAVPYGDHLPFPAHEDNGKCSAAAVLFDLLGDREAASFFGKMATAAYSERERGHTGNYFNILWALQGVARCGPLATGAYWREQSWYYDLARAWDTRWRYQGSPVGEEEHKKYTDWDCSGSHLLDLALPLKTLRLTGGKPFSTPPLDAAQTAEVIAAGRDFAYRGDEDRYEKRTTEQLLAGLSSWSPFVRKRSAAALGKREGDHLPALLELLASQHRDARYGAIEALGALGPRADALDVIDSQVRANLDSPKPLLLYFALTAPHTPWLPSPEFVGKSGAGMYGDFTMMVDAEIGRILAALGKSGLAEDTLVIFTSDNGPTWYEADVKRLGHASAGGWRGMKSDAWEGGHRMPFIVRWPGRVKAGTVSAQTICFTDLLATFAEICGAVLPNDAGPDSFSFLPVLEGVQPTDKPIRAPIVMHAGSVASMMMIRSGDWKLINGLGSGGFTKPGSIKAKPGEPAVQLYNLHTDPAETTNLATKHPDKVQELLSAMQANVERGRSR